MQADPVATRLMTLRGVGPLSKLLVHGARAILRHVVSKEDGLSQWIRHLTERKHVNVAVVALANKTARIAWAITRRDVAYNPELASQAPAIQYN